MADTTVTLQPISNIAKEYWWIVLLVPLILLIILILTFGLIKYSKTKKSKGLKFNKRRKWPWILLIIIIILIILAVVSWFTVFAPDAPAVHVDQYLDDNVKPSIAVDESNLQMLGNALILANEVVNLPIIVSNFHSEAASYEFMTTKTDWIEISKYNMTLKPAQSEVILLNIDARNQSKQELNYTILANIDVVGDQYLETTEFNIKITGLGKSKTRIIIFSIIVVLVILLVISIVFVVSTRKQKRLYRAVGLEEKMASKNFYLATILVLLVIIGVFAYFQAFGLSKTIHINPVKSSIYKLPSDHDSDSSILDLNKIGEWEIIESEVPTFYDKCDEDTTIGTFECVLREDNQMIISFQNSGRDEIEGFYYYVEGINASKFGFDYVATLLYPGEQLHLFADIELWTEKLGDVKQVTIHPVEFLDGESVSCFNKRNTVTIEECNLDDTFEDYRYKDK